MKASPEMVRRVAITQATLDRFKGRPFAWGSADCGQMVAYHLKAMGHRLLLSKWGRYRSAIGAAKAMKRAGFADLSAVLESLGLERIPAAAAIAGDVVRLPQEEGAAFEALTIALGNGRVLGFYGDEGATVLQPVMFETAWRVTCRKS
jgi:hypothetical protein